MSKYCHPFGEVEFEQVGGKGYNLGKLTLQGFNIPDGIIVTTSGYQLFIDENNLDEFIQSAILDLDITSMGKLEKISMNIRNEIEKYQLPEDIKREISDFYESSYTKEFAVRSSATAEDLPNLSFAGQHDTLLNMNSIDQIFSGVITCFSSLWTARAIQYREKNNIDQLTVKIAVIIQEMIKSEKSGVIFTANPITGNRNEVVIEAIFGLGEALVSGQVDPDSYIIREDGSIDKRIGSQKKTIISDMDGGVIEVDEKRADEQVLSDEQIINLNDVATQIDDFYGTPQDIEFGIVENTIYVLQSRNITTLYPQIKTSKNNLRLFFSIGHAQGVLTPFTTYGQDILCKFVYGIGKPFHFTNGYIGQESILIAGERIYADFTSGLTHPMGRRIISRALEAVEPESAVIINQQIHRFPLPHYPPKIKTMQLGSRFVFFMLKKIKLLFKDPDFERRRVKQRSIQFLRYLEQMTKVKTLNGKIQALDTLVFQIPRFLFTEIAPFIASTMMTLIGSQKLGNPEKYELSYLDLSRSYANNVTTKMNLNLWEIACTIKNDPSSLKIFEKCNSEIILIYQNGSLPPILQKSLESFIHEYGFRGYSEIDIGVKKWRDEPEPIINHLRTYLKIDDQKHYPSTLFKKGQIDAENAYKVMLEGLTNTKGGKLKARIFNKLIFVNRKVSGMREYPKFIWVKSMDILKEVLLEVGQILVDQKRIDFIEDVFYLHHEQLKESGRLQEYVKENRLHWEREMERELVPRIILSNGETFYNSISKVELKENILIGSGVSPGVVKARARVILKPKEETLLPGEVLVCPATDPSWTPYFNIASALVMEVGGLMTHGSVVAREHGIAAVVGVVNCTQRINTGDLLKINGITGVVEIVME